MTRWDRTEVISSVMNRRRWERSESLTIQPGLLDTSGSKGRCNVTGAAITVNVGLSL
jgi:hypothetical protein